MEYPIVDGRVQLLFLLADSEKVVCRAAPHHRPRTSGRRAYSTHSHSANSRYATQISELGEIIPPNGVSRGSSFQLTGDGKTYQIAAVPQTYGTTGRQFFYSGQTLVIRAADRPKPDSAASPEIR